MLARIGDFCARGFRRWLPDPFVFALLLTIAAAAAAMVWVRASPAEVAAAWYGGFWRLLDFGMQMVLILVTGSAVALSAPVSRGIDRLAGRLARPGTVYLVVLVVGGVLTLVSWGWVVVTAVLGRELARRVSGLDYPYLVACVYLSSQTWVAGLSSTIPLLLNTPGNFLVEAGLLPATVSVRQTLGSPLNLAVTALLLVGSPLVMWLLRPRRRAVELAELYEGGDEADRGTVAEEAESLRLPGNVPSDRLNASVALQAAVALSGLAYLVFRVVERGLEIDLNSMIFAFLMLGMLLHRTPMRYAVAMRRACSNISGIVFQYPFYAGIMGIMMATGLGKATAVWLASRVSLETLPAAAFVLGGAVNFAIPSAGGEFAVLAPPLVEAVRQLGGSLGPTAVAERVARVSMAVAYGESLTNLLQPFYLLTVLPVMAAGVRLQARDVMGYVFLPFVVLFAAVGLLVTFLP